ncbi:MAG: UbiA family prenyltransferase [Armatimonadetes bacterium]|nr:UbiA family prenyltransferase [Armatimonadota bacterium]
MIDSASSQRSILQQIRVVLEAVKFEHSIFALPFALLGMIYAADGFPSARTIGWIVVAMVGARTSAMAFNRLIDRDVDAKNPRTAKRALPTGQLTAPQMSLLCIAGAGLLVLAAWQLNPLALALSPIALIVVLSYSYAKRFTWLSHFWLGLSLGIAPAAAWVAVTGDIDWAVLWLTGAVAFWVAGFDILYSLQDEAFDREERLHSFPQRFGTSNALLASRVSHLACIGLLIGAGIALGAGAWYFVGALFCAALLAYEQSLVKANDLSRLDMAFFTLNGIMGIVFFGFAAIDKAVA